MEQSRRRLPHFHVEDRWHFVTWHVAGSVPANRYPPPGQPNAGQAFVWKDRYLDSRRDGPRALARDEVARSVLDALLQGHCAERYEASAFVLMANHAHLLLRPAEKLSAAMQWIKGASARAANLVLFTSGRSFWQKESYDRLVRDAQEFERIARCIEWNPVRAGLVGSPEEWRWSSANPEVWVMFQRT